MKLQRLAKALTSLPLIAALAFAACQDDDEADLVRGSGNVVTKEMPLADFTAVEAASAFAVEIVQSDAFSVTIRVDDNILDLLDVSKEGDTLTLGLERGVSLKGPVTLEASITMPHLDGLKLSGASRASVSGFRSSGRLLVQLSGASSVDGNVEAGTVDIDASGASRAELEGTATGLKATASGASTLELAGLPVATAEVSLSGASNATLNARERIDPVVVSGASKLYYLSGPSLGDVRTSGASTVEEIGD